MVGFSLLGDGSGPGCERACAYRGTLPPLQDASPRAAQDRGAGCEGCGTCWDLRRRRGAFEQSGPSSGGNSGPRTGRRAFPPLLSPLLLLSLPWLRGLKLHVRRGRKVGSSPPGQNSKFSHCLQAVGPFLLDRPPPRSSCPSAGAWVFWVWVAPPCRRPWGSRPAPRWAPIQTSRGFCQHVRGDETPSKLGLCLPSPCKCCPWGCFPVTG